MHENSFLPFLFALAVVINVCSQEKVFAQAQSYSDHSVLQNGSWYKFAVNEPGIYKLDLDFIETELEASVSGVAFNQIGIFGNGGGMLPEANSAFRYDDLAENTIQVVDQNTNGKFDAGDYILFYADGPDKWIWDNASSTFNHVENIYTESSYYFLTTDKGSGKIMQQQASSGIKNLTINSFNDYAVHEIETTNLLESGREWYGDEFNSLSPSREFTFSFSNLKTNEPVKLRSSVVAKSIGSSSQFNVRYQNQILVSHNIASVTGEYATQEARKSIDVADFTALSNTIVLSYEFSGGTADKKGWLDFAALNVIRNLSYTGPYMTFRNAASVGPGNISEFVISNANSTLEVWEITDPVDSKIQQSSLIGSQLKFTVATDQLRTFIVYDRSKSVFAIPTAVGKISNQDLHALAGTSPDMIIISHEEIQNEAQTLADFHISNSNLSVAVVPVGQIFNEFGSGAPDITSLRNFIKMLYDKAAGNPSKEPRFLLLFGDASYDFKDRLTDNTNMVPTYQSISSLHPTTTFNSDDYFGFLDDHEGANITTSGIDLDISIGRLPVRNSEEANAIINKIKHYATTKTFGSWRNVVNFIADDEDNNIHLSDADGIAETVRSNYPVYTFDKIYLDAYQQTNTSAGDRYPDVSEAIKKRIFQGALIMNYTGHGGISNWAHERIFDVSDISSLDNFDKMPLFVTATCEFSKFDDPESISAGELLLLNPNGGAIGLVTTVRLVFSNRNEVLNRAFFNQVFKPINGTMPTLGEAVSNAKNAISQDQNNRKFVLLGDPAMTLAYPEYNVVTTKVNGKAIALLDDTIKALSKVTISGEIRDQSDMKMNQFNGVVYPVIYDKAQQIQTLKNDPKSPVTTFLLQKNPLYKGKASVVNGAFSFEFIVPLDINYSFGAGKISYYAENGVVDAHGYSNEIVIGGEASSFEEDTEGPIISIFMNEDNFLFGGITDANPILFVHLEDESGINTSGTAIGHSVTSILDHDDKNKIILNDFYEAELDNYRKGSVTYPLSELQEGRHHISVKAWDVYNNSSESYTEFVVSESAILALENVMNYPNPFNNSTTFQFEHNRPGIEMDIRIEIYSLSGQLVKRLDHQLTPGGYRVNNIEWDGTDDRGAVIGKGTYVYRVNVKNSDGVEVNQFEKLVILR